MSYVPEVITEYLVGKQYLVFCGSVLVLSSDNIGKPVEREPVVLENSISFATITENVFSTTGLVVYEAVNDFFVLDDIYRVSPLNNCI